MGTSKFTLVGFYNYMKDTSEPLFGRMVLPDGIDRQTLIENILIQGGEFEPVFANPVFLSHAIGTWSKKWYRTFDKWYAALQLEYNPIDNYDRHEEYEDEHTGSRSEKGKNKTTGTDGTVESGTEKRDINVDATQTNNLAETLDTTTTNKVSAYDSASLVNHDEQILDSDSTSTGTIDNDTDTTDETTFGKHVDVDVERNSDTESEESENSKTTHKAHLWGNIGVTTSQMMLVAELELDEWNLIEHITDLFIQEFCLMVY